MVTFKAFVRKAGRITIPKDVRERLGLQHRDVVRVIDLVKIEENNPSKEGQ